MTEDSKVKTNLITAMRENKENKFVIKKLIIFMAIEAIVPICVFFGTRTYLAPFLGLSKRNSTLTSAFLAIMTANAIIFSYIYMAFNEPETDEKDKQKEEESISDEVKVGARESKKDK